MHAHLPPPALVAALAARTDLPRIDGGRLAFPGESLAFHDGYTDPDARLREMDRLGIGVQLLSLPPLFGIDSLPADQALPLTRAFNDGIAAVCAARPGRFAWLAALPLADPDAAACELGRALHDGAVGAILPGDCFGSEALAAAMAPLMARLDADHAIAFLHPGRRPGAPVAVAEPPDLRWARRQVEIQAAVAQTAITLLHSAALDPFPDLTVQVANLAGCLPMVEDRIARVIATRDIPARRRKPRLIADCASLGPQAIRIAEAILGPGTVVFGSDAPIFGMAASAEAIAAAASPDPDALRSGTALQALRRAGFTGS